MAIIISKSGKDAQKLEQRSVDEEDYLQRYVSDNPDSLPFDEIKEGTKLLVIGREFDTDSGPIDVLAVDGDGDIYIIETKLFKNPDKRHVIAQMLDYGASLWKRYGAGGEFLGDIDSFLAKSKAGGLSERLRKLYGLDEQGADDVRSSIERNLTDGNIRFVVLMDRLHDRLRDLILFINHKSQFTIYAVEMELYQHDEMEIVIPKLFGAEAKKDVSGGSGGRRPKLNSEEDFFKAVEGEETKRTFRKLLEFGEALGAIRSMGSSSIAVKLPDPNGSKQPITLFVMDIYGGVYIGWTRQQCETLGLPLTLSEEYAKSIASIFPSVHVRNEDALSRTPTAEEVDKTFDKFAATVRAFVEQIKKASRA